MSGTSARFTLKSELISLISEKNPDFLTWRFWITSYNCTCMEEIPVCGCDKLKSARFLRMLFRDDLICRQMHELRHH
ncbi:hypothetical protein, partial [uncultured Desulfovibrio sp.]|uniref:hypothetical protein n=1 Tax=uncultured Desulfovibrio sp. TaxID=167968 RepID=UPI0025986A8B